MAEIAKYLTPEALEARRAYYREYQKAHPEKVREYQRKYWERKVEEQKAKVSAK